MCKSQGQSKPCLLQSHANRDICLVTGSPFPVLACDLSSLITSRCYMELGKVGSCPRRWLRRSCSEQYPRALSQNYSVPLGLHHRASTFLPWFCSSVPSLLKQGSLTAFIWHSLVSSDVFASLSLRASDPNSPLFYSRIGFRQEPWLVVCFTGEASRRTVPGCVLLQCLLGLSV